MPRERKSWVGMSQPDVEPTSVATARAGVAEYVELVKLPLVSLVLLTTVAGYSMGYGGAADSLFLLGLAPTIVGTGLAACGAMALNQYAERRTDGLMARTRRRPLPSGRMAPAEALVAGLALSALGVVYLVWVVNVLVSGLGALAIVGYLLVYTPLKYRTPLALVIGAVPGAAPPLLGWTAITGQLDAGGLALFAILLFWQMPHFLAITLFRKADFTSAGIRCVPVVRGDRAAKVQAVLWALGLVPVSVLPTYLGVAGWFYGAVAGVLSLVFLGWTLTGFRSQREVAWARSLFFASLLLNVSAMLAARSGSTPQTIERGDTRSNISLAVAVSTRTGRRESMPT